MHFPAFGRCAHVICFPWVVIGAYDCLHMTWLAKQKIAPLFQPIRGKSKANGDLSTCAFPRLIPVTCIFFESWLNRFTVYACWDWLERKSDHFSSQSEESYDPNVDSCSTHLQKTRIPTLKKEKGSTHEKKLDKLFEGLWHEKSFVFVLCFNEILLLL